LLLPDKLRRPQHPRREVVIPRRLQLRLLASWILGDRHFGFLSDRRLRRLDVATSVERVCRCRYLFLISRIVFTDRQFPGATIDVSADGRSTAAAN
jgi:hypothetical protein